MPLLLISLVLLLAAIGFLSSPFNLIAALALLFLPIAWLSRRELNKIQEEQCNIKTLVAALLFSGTIGISLVMTIELVFTYPAALVIFQSDAEKYLKEMIAGDKDIQDPEHRHLRWEMSRRWQYWVFMVYTAFAVIGFAEENLKYWTIMAARRWGKVVKARDYVAVGVATALGFALTENLSFVAGAWQEDEIGLKFMLTVLERMVLAIPLHSMTAILIAFDIEARDMRNEPRSYWRILKFPVVFHGLFDLTAFTASAYEGNIGWVHPKRIPVLFLTCILILAQVLVLCRIFFSRLRRSQVVL